MQWMRTQTRRMAGWRASIVILACAVVALAGCGSSSGSSSGSNSSSGTSSSGSARGSPIKLLASASVGSPLADFPEVQVAAQAAADEINKAGGVNGHPLDVDFCNTRSDANQSQVCARQAVSGKDAAVVGLATNFSNLMLPILQSASIPAVGLYTLGAPIDRQSPDVFALNGGTTGNFLADPYGLVAEGRKKLAIAVLDVPEGIANGQSVASIAPRAGMQVVGTVKIPATGVSDYSTYAAQLAKLRADSVVLVVGPSVEVALMKASHALGFDPTWSAHSILFGEQDAAQADGLAEGMVIASPYPSIRSTSDPLIAAFTKSLKAAGTDPQTSSAKYAHWSVGINAWLSVYAVAAAAKGIKGDVTGASLTQALKQSGTLSLPGGISWNPSAAGPSGYPRFAQMTSYFVTIKNGRLATLPIKPVDVATKLR